MIVVAAQAAAARGRWICGIVGELVGAFVLRLRRTQRAITGSRVGAAGRMEIVARAASAGQGPVVLIAPRVLAHHENPHGLLARDAVIDAPQQVVVPPQYVGVGIALGGLAE